MKKSVVLVILAVYILSVCVVGFFGIKIKQYYETVNVESIKITSVTDEQGNLLEMGKTADENPVSSVTIEAKKNTTVTFKVYYEVNPANATDPSVLLNYNNTDPSITVTKSPGEQAVIVTFEIKSTTKSLSLTIQNNINTSISDTIVLFVKVKLF